MPRSRIRLKCRHLFTFIALVFLVPESVEAQTARVSMQGAVSETVALSVGPNLTHGDVAADVVSNGKTVRITLSGIDAKAPVVRVPLLVRSNSPFKISAAVESSTADLAQLSIVDVRPTGTLVSPGAISGLNVPPEFDRRGLNEAKSNSLDDSRPLLIVSGPRVSLGGTLNSRNNALEITVLIRLQPQPVHGWSVHLTFAASAVSLIQ